MSLTQRIAKAGSLEELRGLSRGYDTKDPATLINFSNAFYSLNDVDSARKYARAALKEIIPADDLSKIIDIDCMFVSTSYDSHSRGNSILEELTKCYKNDPIKLGEIIDYTSKWKNKRTRSNKTREEQVKYAKNQYHYAKSDGTYEKHHEKQQQNRIHQGFKSKTISLEDEPLEVYLEGLGMNPNTDIKSLSSDDVNKIYRKRALDCHPDLYTGNEEKEEEFKKLGEARERVLNEISKANG